MKTKKERKEIEKKTYSSKIRYFIRKISDDGLIKTIPEEEHYFSGKIFDEYNGYNSIKDAKKAIDDENLRQVDYVYPNFYYNLIILPIIQVKYE